MALAHATWRVARLAAHYPAHFYAAVLGNLGLGVGGGMYPVLVYVVEAQRHGVSVIGPGVNGPWHSTPEDFAVRCGLLLLQGAINVATLERIHAAALQRAFSSVADLCARVDLSPTEMERLIAAGALDDLVTSRRHARWEAQFAHVRPLDQTSLLDAGTWPRPPTVEAETVQERAAEEYAVLGFTLSLDHPLELHVAALDGYCLTLAAQLDTAIGRFVTVAGIVVAERRHRTTNGRLMIFISLCDYSGVMELTLFEQAAERYANMIHHGEVIVASGTVTQHAEHGIGIDVRRIHSRDRDCRLTRQQEGEMLAVPRGDQLAEQY